MQQIVQQLIIGLVFGGVYALMAVGLTLTFGVMRIINLAHSAFIIFAAYLSFWLFKLYHVDPILSVIINMPTMFVLGVLVYRVVFTRLSGSRRFVEASVLLTFGLAMVIEGVMGYLWTGIYRSANPPYASQSARLGSLLIPLGQLYATLISVVLLAALGVFLYRTRLGYAIRATMQNRTAAQIVGVDVERVSMIAFGIGTALAGASGALMSFLFSFYPAVHWQWIAVLLALVMVGGLGSLSGALVASLALSIIAVQVGYRWGPTWSPATFLLALFFVLLVRPQGLFGKKMEV